MTNATDARNPFSRNASFQEFPEPSSQEDAGRQEPSSRARSFPHTVSRAPRDNRRTAPDGRPHRPSLLEETQNLDRELLKLLLRRNNLLLRLRDKYGQMHPQEERELRSSWEQAASRISRDARLVRQLFTLLQQVAFLPKPVAGEERRPAFNLAPARKPVDVRMPAPLACRRSRLYLTLAAVSGNACRITPSLLNDPTVECIKMFNQCGTSLAWEDDGTLYARKGGGFTAADKVVFVGDNMLNFCLLLGQYVMTPSHAKFTGEASLKMTDLTALRHFLPQLGARMTCVVPHSEGLPVRIECSGILPDTITAPADVPADLLTGLLLAAPFQSRPLTFHLDAHPARQALLDEAVAVLKDCKAALSCDGFTVHITPAPLRIPTEPRLPMELSLAAYLLALPAAVNGVVRLEGRWPQDAYGDAIRSFLRHMGILTRVTDNGVTAERAANLTAERPLDASALPVFYAPLAVASAAITAHIKKQCPAPLLPQGTSLPEVESFLHMVGLELADGILRRTGPISDPEDTEQHSWTAPSAEWAIALALTAFVHPGLKLTSPGVVTSLYPAFWSFYNGLPCPQSKRRPEGPVDEKPVRRRIIAGYYPGTESGDSSH